MDENSCVKLTNFICFSITGVYGLLVTFLFNRGSNRFKEAEWRDDLRYHQSDDCMNFTMLRTLALCTFTSWTGACVTRIIAEIFNSSWDTVDIASFLAVGFFVQLGLFFFFTFYVLRLKHSFLNSIYDVSNKFCLYLFSFACLSDIMAIIAQFLMRYDSSDNPADSILYTISWLMYSFLWFAISFKFAKNLYSLILSQKRDTIEMMRKKGNHREMKNIDNNHTRAMTTTTTTIGPQFNENQENLLQAITKQTVLIMIPIVSGTVYIIMTVVFDQWLMDDGGLLATMVRVLEIICFNILIMSMMTCLWLSFSFEKDKYQHNCSRCNQCVYKCASSVASKAIRQSMKKRSTKNVYALLGDS